MVIFVANQDDTNGGLKAPPAVAVLQYQNLLASATAFPAFGNAETIR
jgi:hypothetical protein